jgi:hypothetical protein
MKPALVLIKYYPKLGPFTNTWDDLVNDIGEPLHVGILNYNKTTTSTFRACVKPQDVKTSLVMLSYLFLEHHTVEDLLVFDSSMLLSLRVLVCISTWLENPITCLLGLLSISWQCQFCVSLSLIIARWWLPCHSRKFLFLRSIVVCLSTTSTF